MFCHTQNDEIEMNRSPRCSQNVAKLAGLKNSCCSLVDRSAFTELRKLASLLLLGIVFVSLTGCSTLSSLGLPVSSSTNQIIRSAKQISNAPGQALQLPSELRKQPLSLYVVEIGDSIFVEPVSFDATIRLSGDQVVRPDGTISLGEFGQYDAFNKTIQQIQLEVQQIIDEKSRAELIQQFEEERRRERELESIVERPGLEGGSSDSQEGTSDEVDSERERELQIELEKRIAERQQQNRISVRLVNCESKKIYVLGEVNSPGFFSFIGNETVLDAIIEAGGLTAKANHHQIIVARPTECGSCRVVMKVCYDQIVQLGDTSTNYQLMPGDRVFVPNLTLLDDLKKTFSFNKDPACPRCAPCQQGCELPMGCTTSAEYK